MQTVDDPAAATDFWSRPYPLQDPREMPALSPAAASTATAAGALEANPAAVDPSAPDLPGCRPTCFSRHDLDAHDERFEYWDGHTGTAWVMEPTGLAHEQPAIRLTGLCALIAAALDCKSEQDFHARLRGG